MPGEAAELCEAVGAKHRPDAGQALRPGRRLPTARMAALHHRFTALHESLRRDTPQLAADAIQKVLADPRA